MMNKCKLVLFIIILMALMGCSNKDVFKHKYYFKGENAEWEVYYQERSVVTFTEKDRKLDCETDTESIFTVVYKYDLSDLEDVKKIEIGYDAGLFSSYLSEQYDEGGPDRKAFVIESTSGFVSQENGSITANISIDGVTETIELEKQ